MTDLKFVRKYPDKCCAEVTRRGEPQPCDKVAVAAKRDIHGAPWPVCAYHTRGQMVPLAELLATTDEGDGQ